jgi:uncharacterized protein
MSPFDDTLILFFVKYPEPGHVKTRLSKAIGPVDSAELYRRFALDMLDGLRESRFPLLIFFYPDIRAREVRDWLGEDHPYSPQKGKDLGERMSFAFQDVFGKGYKRVVLLGSDTPDLPASILQEAMESLQHRTSVIGPTLDGGYYLIGFQKEAFCPDIFKGVPWGGKTVFRETLSILHLHRNNPYVLPAWRDVDDLEDLKALGQRTKGSDFSGSRTASYLSRILLSPTGEKE